MPTLHYKGTRGAILSMKDKKPRRPYRMILPAKCWNFYESISMFNSGWPHLPLGDWKAHADKQGKRQLRGAIQATFLRILRDYLKSHAEIWKIQRKIKITSEADQGSIFSPELWNDSILRPKMPNESHLPRMMLRYWLPHTLGTVMRLESKSLSWPRRGFLRPFLLKLLKPWFCRKRRWDTPTS